MSDPYQNQELSGAARSGKPPQPSVAEADGRFMPANDARDPVATSGHRISIMALAAQALRSNLDAGDRGAPVIPCETTGGRSTTVSVYSGIPDLMRAIATVGGDYVVFSSRPDLIWDPLLINRIDAEITAAEDRAVGWLCLCADGADLKNISYAAAHFNAQPTLTPDRGRRLIIQSSGTLYVVNVAAMRQLSLSPVVWPDMVRYLNALIAIGYSRGLPSFFTSGLFPCLTGRRDLVYPTSDEVISTLNPNDLLTPGEANVRFPQGERRKALVRGWVDDIEAALKEKHRFSFVIRTLFRRPHLLRRCLISIEYLRSRLALDIEIVIATDSAHDLADKELSRLKEEFPKLVFVLARGEEHPGFSRVRNLVGGIKATTGSRVCIIDDDDYYAPQAVGLFDQACAFDSEHLLIFDTQIIGERWIEASLKWQREIVSYGAYFAAKNWTATLRGSNSIPFCGIIHPGWFVREIAKGYNYGHDLSEDFIFHLQCFVHPKRPPIKVIEEICAYQSHRAGDDNVSNLENRTDWVADTGNGLYQLLLEDGFSFDAISGAEVALGEVSLRASVEALKVELVKANHGRTQATILLAKLVQQATVGIAAQPKTRNASS